MNKESTTVEDRKARGLNYMFLQSEGQSWGMFFTSQDENHFWGPVNSESHQRWKSCTARGTNSVCVCINGQLRRFVSFSICEDGRCVNFCRRLWMCETTGNRRLTFSQIPASHSAQSRTRAPDRCSERLPAAWGYHGDDLDKRQRDKKKLLL